MIDFPIIWIRKSKRSVAIIVLSIIILLVILVIAGGHKYNHISTNGNVALDSIEEYDPAHPCGVVSATIVTHILSNPIEFSTMAKAISVDGMGRVSMIDLMGGLRRVGFSAVGVRLNERFLQRIPGSPVILYVNRSHFLVVIPTEDGSTVVIDPPHKPYLGNWDSVSFHWSGEAILVKNNSEEIKELLTSLGIKNLREAAYDDR